MSNPVSHTGAEIHRLRWFFEGFATTTFLVVLMTLVPVATVVAIVLAALFMWAEVAR